MKLSKTFSERYTLQQNKTDERPCNFIIRFQARDEEKEKKVDEISNRKSENDIRKSNEEIVKKQEEDKKTRESLMALSDDELDEELESLRAELDELKNPKEAKSANRELIGVDNSDLKITKRHVLKLNDNQRNTKGDELLKSLGSK